MQLEPYDAAAATRPPFESVKFSECVATIRTQQQREIADTGTQPNHAPKTWCNFRTKDGAHLTLVVIAIEAR